MLSVRGKSKSCWFPQTIFSLKKLFLMKMVNYMRLKSTLNIESFVKAMLQNIIKKQLIVGYRNWAIQMIKTCYASVAHYVFLLIKLVKPQSAALQQHSQVWRHSHYAPELTFYTIAKSYCLCIRAHYEQRGCSGSLSPPLTGSQARMSIRTTWRAC